MSAPVGAGDDDEAAAPAGGRAALNLRERLGIRPLSVKTQSSTAESPGAVTVPLPARRPSRPGSAPQPGLTNAPSDFLIRQGSLLGSTVMNATLKAQSFARKLAIRRARSAELDEEALPPFDAASLFADGESALQSLEGQHTSITIHRTDELPHDWRIAHPLICMHVLNGATGRYLRKSDVERPVTTPNECANAAGS